jgi:hypothetical protein
MAIQASAFITLNPAYHEPEFLMQYSQPSGFVDVLSGGALRARLSEDDLLVYMKQLNVRTKVASGQAGGFQELPGADIAASMISTTTYMLKSRAQYDHHDVATGGRWGFAVPEAYRLANRQGNFQLCRDAALFGMNPANGEGFLNAPNATATNLPPDSFGNDTVQTYDNGQMAFFLAQLILAIKTRTLQLGIGRKFTILGPQRTLGTFEYNVVQLTQFQRPGAGTASTRETLDHIAQANGDVVEWAYDDTLIGAGDNGWDAVIVAMPEVENPQNANPINTNVFAGVMPSTTACLLQYCDMAAPRELITPLPGGGTDVVNEWRISSGWAPRAQALTIVSMQYS